MIRNELFGVYKIAKLGGVTYIVKKITDGRDMDVQDESYVQGTAETRILNIGMVSENFSVDAPILIGGGSKYDGRTLLNENILNALKKTEATLPILNKATIDVDSERGATISLQLVSDGDKTNKIAFSVENGDPPAELDPTTNMPTRVAKHFDFRAQLGPYKYYIQNAKLELEVKIDKKCFIGGTRSGLSYPLVVTGDNAPTQFPFMGVKGMSLSGSGTAAVEIGVTNDPQMEGGADVTYQRPGETVIDPLAAQDPNYFTIEIYDATQGDWAKLFAKEDGTPLIDLSKSVINKAEFTTTNEMITVNFAFRCYIKVQH